MPCVTSVHFTTSSRLIQAKSVAGPGKTRPIMEDWKLLNSHYRKSFDRFQVKKFYVFIVLREIFKADNLIYVLYIIPAVD